MKKILHILFRLIFTFAFTGLVGCVNDGDGDKNGSVTKKDKNKETLKHDNKSKDILKDNDDYSTASVGLEFDGNTVTNIGNCTFT